MKPAPPVTRTSFDIVRHALLTPWPDHGPEFRTPTPEAGSLLNPQLWSLSFMSIGLNDFINFSVCRLVYTPGM